MKRIFIPWILLLLTQGLAAQKAVGEYLMEAEEAIGSQNFQKALEIFKEGKAAFPMETEFYLRRAELFSSRKLYPLALDEYLGLIGLAPSNWSALLGLGETYAILEEYEKSVDVFREGLKIYPGDSFFSQSLAWQYFKGEQYLEGAAVVSQALDLEPQNPYLHMTMATLQGHLYRYEAGRASYLRAVELGLESGNQALAAVGSYNLSILETTFLQYQRAFDALQKALEWRTSASSQLGMGELYESQQNFSKALEWYKSAERLDETPFSLLSLANLYFNFGRLDQALFYAQEVQKRKDSTWMHNYGITKAKWDKDLHELLYRIYTGKKEFLNFEPRFWPWEWADWWGRVGHLSLLAWYHEQNFRQATIEQAKNSLSRDNTSTAWWGLSLAYENYPSLAIKYLDKAQDYEIPRIPRLLPLFQLERAKILKDPLIFERAYSGLDPLWQRVSVVELLQNWIPLLEGQRKERERRLLELYTLNPGALLRKGLSLPLRVTTQGGDSSFKDELRNFMSDCGYTFDTEGRETNWPVLEVQHQGKALGWTLRDSDGNLLRKNDGVLPFEGLREGFKALFQSLYSL